MSDVEAVYDLYIGGASVPASAGGRATLLDPATNRPLADTAVGRADDAEHAMEVAEAAFRSTDWARDDGGRRARALVRLAQRLEGRADEFALLETRNNGKTLRESRGDIAFAVRTLEYVAGLADKIEGQTIPVPGPRFDFTLREPLGVTVHIAPWNFPLVLALRSVAPALAAGNAVVLKPASLTPLTALRFAALATESGIPDGILNVVVGSGAEVGEALIRDPRCRSVSFTGSLDVGRRIAELAALHLVPATLELGGKSPVVVFPDADLDRAARSIANGIFSNAGQMCWAGSRVVVHASVHDALLDRVRSIAEKIRIGPGVDDGIDMGPLVSRDQVDRVLGYVERARAEGLRVVTGGARAAGPGLAEGNFLQPTVVDEVPPDSRVAQEEIFGPVLAVSRFDEVEEAVHGANASRFGLFAAVWTRDLGTAHRVAQQLDAGIVTVNDPPHTYPQAPFAGFKDSGLGFEQGSDSVRAYTRRKNVIVNVAAPRTKR
jgi:aldehyde dehydrogenase (NAD+)